MAKDAREIFGLECTKCKEINYKTMRNVKLQKDKLELNKYCPKCKAHQPHKETKHGVKSK